MRRLPVAGLLLTLAVAAAVAAQSLDGGGSPVPSDPGTLADYWRGEARWTLDRKWTARTLAQERPYDGAHIEIVGDHWYLFNRRRYPESCANGLAKMGVQVRESTDRGASWSEPVPVIEPAAESEWACAATDGDAFYDAGEERWHYLFQCLDASTSDDDGDWNGCYLEREGDSPMGRFSAPEGAINPVIRSGDLWRSICDPGDDCARPAGEPPVEDEGTFNIFGFDGRDYWVAFHGFDGVRGYRTVAKTPTFMRGSYAVDGTAPGLPSDSILDASDALGFRERWIGAPVGAGAGTIVSEDGLYYALAEFPDVSLNCTDGQNWNVGLFRSTSLASTTWEAFPAGNPIVSSSRTGEAGGHPRACNVLYPTLFQDPGSGTWYLMHGRSTADPAHDAIYVYRLERERSLLVNGDFWRDDAAGWSPAPNSAVNVAVHRDPNGSPDGTPYVAFNCGGAACSPQASLFQDVTVDAAAAGRRFEFGGSFRTDGPPASVALAVHQLDVGGNVIASDSVEIRAGPTYATRSADARIEDGARTLRYQLYPRTPQTVSADNLFLEPR